MKRLDYTKVSVKLKKSEWRDEWFIYLEAYPVYETGNDKPNECVNISGGLLLPYMG